MPSVTLKSLIMSSKEVIDPKLLRAQRSSKSHQKRKQNETAENPKRRCCNFRQMAKLQHDKAAKEPDADDEKVKILHNDIKINNVVLDGNSLAKAEAILIDFKKAKDQISPKVYVTPADTQQFKHLAPELGQVNGKQSKKSDVYSLGFLIRTLKYKFSNFPSMFVKVCRSCLRTNASLRPSASDLCEQLVRAKQE